MRFWDPVWVGGNGEGFGGCKEKGDWVLLESRKYRGEAETLGAPACNHLEGEEGVSNQGERLTGARRKNGTLSPHHTGASTRREKVGRKRGDLSA